jgi:FG-GAP-like repeat
MEFVMATIITPFGPEFQININNSGNNGISGAQDLANLAALTDGRFVVAYQSDYFGSATDTDPIVAIFDGVGSTSLSYLDVNNSGGNQKVPAVAERLDGGFGVVFQNDRHANNTVDANGPNITYVPVSAAGGLLSAIAVGDFNAGAGHDALQNPEIATLSSGRQVVAFERVWTAGVDHDVFLNVVNEAGTATQFSIANPLDVQANASWQANPSVAAIGNQALVVFEDGTSTTTASANIRGRFFSGDTNTLGAAFTIADHAGRLRTADVAAIDDHRYAIVYGDQNDVWAKILDSTTGVLSPEVQMDVAGGFSLNPAIAGLPGSGFVATWAQHNGADYDVRARLFDSTGAPLGSDFIVTSLTDSSQFTPDVTVSGSHVFFAWTDFASRPEDGAATGVRGRIFGVDEPPNDFNGDARSDILWQSSSGMPAAWLMNGANAVTVSGVGSFNPGPSWQVKGSGDFNGDGKYDILWQGSDGTPAIWLMDGSNVLSNSAAGSFNPGPSWQIKGSGDFNGDGKSDILWQGTDGTPAIWLMDGSNVLSNSAAGSFNPGPSWQIKGSGDFNGDGKSDILWQHDSGLPAIWTMDGTNVTQTAVAGSFNPGADWHIIL